MSTRPRPAVDLDEMERQLSQGLDTSAPAASGRGDPLAELARIVGQDDPFKRILAAERPKTTVKDADDLFGTQDLRGAVAAEQPAYVEPQVGPAHAAYGGPEDYGDYVEDEPPMRSRKGLITVGAVLGVAVVGVAGVLVFGRGAATSGREPPVIQADKGPMKVAPAAPGGIEIPNGDKKIYQPGSAEKETKVVTRSETPIDVHSTRPSATGSVTRPESGEEPRRVRTVLVRPDGTIAPETPTPPNAATTGSTSTPSARKSERSAAPTTPAAAPSATASKPTEAPATPAPVKVQTRVAAANPPPVESPAQLAPPSSSAKGNYVVQLSSSPKESDAKSSAAKAKDKFAGLLDGRAPGVKKAEVNGNTVYRVRVGPMAKDEAGSLCTKIKGAGGTCIVAMN